MSTPWDDAPAYMDFERPMGYDQAVAHNFEKPGAERAGKKRGKKAPGDDEKPTKAVIPVLPPPPVVTTGDETRQGVTQREKAAVNMKLEGASYVEIAEMLEYATAREAKTAVEKALAATHSPDEWDSLRMIASARAEKLFKRSSAMAAASFLVDQETGEKIANLEQLRWHQQAGTDLMNWATISGAKAATKIEVTPGEERMDALVSEMLSRLGHEDIVDAEVIELGEVPEEPEDDGA